MVVLALRPRRLLDLTRQIVRQKTLKGGRQGRWLGSVAERAVEEKIFSSVVSMYVQIYVLIIATITTSHFSCITYLLCVLQSIVSEPPRGLLSIGAQAQAAAGDEGHAGQVMSPIGNKKSVADKDLVLDPSATIAPNAYSVLWEQLDVSVQFKTTIQPPPQPDGAAPRTEGEEQDDDDAAIMVDALCRHLSSRGFFVVASGGGHDNGISKLFAFASGYPLDFYSGAYNQEDRNPVYFLAEMKVEFHGGVGSFECKTKTTHKNFSAAFVSKFSLGSVISRA
jgi:hypothetical protein